MADSQALRDLIALREREIARGYDAKYDDCIGPAYLIDIALGFFVDGIPRDRSTSLHACSLLIAAVECMDRAAQTKESSAPGPDDAA